jgi:DNA-binding MarR family transcriptional regulator
MTLTLNRLESAGWLTRSHDPSDRPRVRLRLTRAGSEAVMAVNEDIHAWQRAIAGRRLTSCHRPSAIDDLLEPGTKI